MEVSIYPNPKSAKLHYIGEELFKCLDGLPAAPPELYYFIHQIAEDEYSPGRIASLGCENFRKVWLHEANVAIPPIEPKRLKEIMEWIQMICSSSTKPSLDRDWMRWHAIIGRINYLVGRMEKIRTDGDMHE